jgi:glutaredoxin
MGRILIFTHYACFHSVRAKRILKHRSLPFTEINLTLHPSKIDMLYRMCGKRTVPQIFFNKDYIGVQFSSLLKKKIALNAYDRDTGYRYFSLYGQ